MNNNLTIINKIYKIVCDIEPARSQDTFEENASKRHQNENAEKSNESEQEEQEIIRKSEKKYVALTFDDGPHPKYTGEILSILEDKKTPATFFVVGFRAELHPDLIKRMEKAKCEIGNHTYEHADLLKISGGSFMSQMEKCSDAIYNITSEYPKIYRPPFGRINKANEQLIKDKMEKILWTVDSFDWKTKCRDRIVNNVINNVKNRSVILMHDFYSQTVEALPEIIDALKGQGYEFVTISDLKELADLPDRIEHFMD